MTAPSTNIAITGGIAAGKSTYMTALRQSFPTATFLSMDELVDRLYTNPLWLSWLEEKFGTSNRAQISKLAFSNPGILSQLNAQSALKIGVSLGRTLSRPGVKFVEFPLLFESGLQDQFDYCVLITANTQVRVQRVVARGKKTAQQAADVIAAQMPEERKVPLADIVIDTTIDGRQKEQASELIQAIEAFTKQASK